MSLTWMDTGVLTLLFTLGFFVVQGLARLGASAKRHEPPAACDRHTWVRLMARGFVCQECGKFPG